MESPTYFADEMLEGQFKSFKHEHTFVAKNGTTVMIDSIEYETPFGALGRLFDKIILKKYLTALIQKRNEFIKTLAENNIGTI